MAKQNDLRALLNSPNARQMLDYIASAEGTKGKGLDGYNVEFGGGLLQDLSKHPERLHEFTQTDGTKNQTSAAGRYQFLAKTAQGLSKQLGLKDFGPEAQDLMALELIRQKGALPDVLAGNYEGAINKLGSVWASLPSSPYAQPKKSMEEILGGGNMPVAMVNRGGQQMLAIPEDGREQAFMEGFHRNGYPEPVQATLTNALARVTDARNQLSAEQPLFDDMPTDLDGELLDLIDRA